MAKGKATTDATTDAARVLELIDQKISELQASAGDVCADALLGGVDRETYREAIKGATLLKEFRAFRKEVAVTLGAD